MKRLYALVLMLVTLPACYSPGRDFHDELGGRSETGRPALHSVQDKHLRQLMGRMDALMQERIMSEAERDKERRKYAQLVAGNAKNLAQTVDSIIDRLPSLQLPSDEQHTFMALAQKLREQSQQLQTQATQNQIDSIPDTMHQINVTCTSCHALFRKSGN